MSEKIWNSFQSLGDDLITNADESKVRTHFLKKRLMLIKVIAACVLLVFSVSLPLSMLPKTPGSKNLFDSTGNYNSALKYELDFENKSLNINQTPIVTLRYELSNLDDGRLDIKIDLGSSSCITANANLQDGMNENSPPKTGTIDIPIDSLSNNTTGQILISFKFKPNKQDKYSNVLKNGYLELTSFYIPFEIKDNIIIFGEATKK